MNQIDRCAEVNSNCKYCFCHFIVQDCYLEKWVDLRPTRMDNFPLVGDVVQQLPHVSTINGRLESMVKICSMAKLISENYD